MSKEVSKEPVTAGQTAYRVLVMSGTLAVIAMAAYLYGPSWDRLSQLANKAAGGLNGMIESRGSSNQVAPVSKLANAPFAPTQVPFHHDNNLQVVSHQQVSGGTPTEILRAAGAKEVSVTPWGGTMGEQFVLVSASFPTGPNGLLIQQIEVIEETAAEAAQEILAAKALFAKQNGAGANIATKWTPAGGK